VISEANGIEKTSSYDVVRCAVDFFWRYFFAPFQSRALARRFAIPLAARSPSISGLTSLSTFFTLLGSCRGHRHLQRSTINAPVLHIGKLFPSRPSKAVLPIELPSELFDQCQDHPAVIISNAWPWDFEYHVEHVNCRCTRKISTAKLKGYSGVSFQRDHCIFLPPEAAYENALFGRMAAEGYAMKMDAKLYRTLFARYDVRSAIFVSGRPTSAGFPLLCFASNDHLHAGITRHHSFSAKRGRQSARLFGIHRRFRRIVVVDSGSKDGTQQIANDAGARVYEHSFKSFRQQRNWALENCDLKSEWVLFLDADEVCPHRNFGQAVTNAIQRRA